jgi:hypothetical protein
MLKIPHTFVDFHGDFPRPEPPTRSRDSKEKIPGRELAEFLVERLRAKGYAIEEPKSEDLGYLIKWRNKPYAFEINVWVDDLFQFDRWTLQTSWRRCGFWFSRSRIDQKSLKDLKGLLETLDQILKDSDKIRDLRWFPSFEPPRELKRQVGYAGPTSEVAVWKPRTTRVHRGLGIYERYHNTIMKWCLSGALGGVGLYVLFGGLGFHLFAAASVLFIALSVAVLFVAAGILIIWYGVNIFQQRREERHYIAAYIGSIRDLIFGLFLVWAGIAGVWACLRNWPR